MIAALLPSRFFHRAVPTWVPIGPRCSYGSTEAPEEKAAAGGFTHAHQLKVLVLNHFAYTNNHLVRANRDGRMLRRSPSAFLLQSNHCMLIIPYAHLLKLYQKCDGDLTTSLGIIIVIKCTPVSNLSWL